MEYLSRLSGLVSTPAKAAAGIAGSPRLRKKPSLHPVGSVDVFHADWHAVQAELENPDERALFFGVARSDLPRRLQRLVDALVFESNRSNDGHTGPCMEYLLKYDILTELVHLSVDDRPKGIRGETIRALTNLIILLDEKFLSRHAVNKPISQLIQLCLDEDAARFQLDDDSFDATSPVASGSSTATATADADYEEDLVDLMCHIASRIRNTPDLLHIFFSDEPVDDAHDPTQARSLKDGSIIVSRSLLDDPSPSEHASPALASAEPASTGAEWEQRPASPTGSIDSTATIQPSTAVTARKQDKRRLRFPLFSYLLKFVHREGRIGELARAGLLFLISLESAHSSSKTAALGTHVRPDGDDIRRSLAGFIAHSDFADVLGAGLGAAYGLLPSRMKPVPRYDPASIEPASSKARASITLASSSAAAAEEAAASEALASATQSDDRELQSQLRLVVDLIEFCQDVIDSLWLSSKNLPDAHSSTPELAEKEGGQEGSASARGLDPMVRKLARAIALAIRDTFIRNVVYPSLMESSDFDGSSAAVLNYLDVMVIVLRSGHMLTEVALDFLLPAEVERDAPAYAIDLPADEADRYSIKDLVLDCLDPSKRPATRVAALKLARTLVVCHGVRACSGLLALPPRRAPTTAPDEWMSIEREAVPGKEGTAGVEMHLREIDAFSALLAALGAGQSSEAQQASLSNYLLDAERALRLDSTFALALELGADKVHLVPSDALVQQVLHGLATMFAQPVEVNLALTGVVSALACSPLRSLEGWLTHAPGVDEVPALVELLAGLVQQVEAYRAAVPGFDEHLRQRRRSLVLTDDLSAALDVDAAPDVQADADAVDKKGSPPSLTLPRMGKGGGGLRTVEQTRGAEREFGIVQDTRASLAAAVAEVVPVVEEAPAARGGSAIARLFGGRPPRTSIGKSTVETERPAAGERKLSSSTINPYADHFRQTAAVWVKTQPAQGAELWRPPATTKAAQEATATLSSVLDNTILLEELVKELVAIVQVRRSWGIDLVAFV